MAKRKKRKLTRAPLTLILKTQLLLILGFILVIIPVLFYINEDIQLSFFTPLVNAHKSIYPQAVKIIIPKIELSICR